MGRPGASAKCSITNLLSRATNMHLLHLYLSVYS